MPTPPPQPRLWLVRHGQTDWNVQRRIQGHTPTALNAAGFAQARRLADFFSGLSFSAVWSSDLPRAAQTAQVIADRLRLPLSTTIDLRERELGAYEGKTWDQIHTMRSAANGMPSTGDLANWTGIPGVETDTSFWQRVERRLAEISSHSAGDVLVVTHGGVIKHAVCHVLGIPGDAPRRFPLANGIVAILQRKEDYFYLLSLVDIDLLAGRESPADTALAANAPSA